VEVGVVAVELLATKVFGTAVVLVTTTLLEEVADEDTSIVLIAVNDAAEAEELDEEIGWHCEYQSFT
jgi:hypothetical protein